MISRVEWAKEFCKEISAPDVNHNHWALVAWQAAEGGSDGAKFNPLNTTIRMPGSTTFNFIGVQNYVSLTSGLTATRRTLEDGSLLYKYRAILHHLRAGVEAEETLIAVRDSSWGTGGLALRILSDVKHNWDEYSNIPIGQ